MTDTMEQTAEGTDTGRKNSVQYTLEVVDDLPPKQTGGGGGRSSVLENKLTELQGREDFHGKWVLIGKYGKATAAGAAANVLRQRHGRTANVEGFEFAYRKITGQDGVAVSGLFVRFDPSKVVPGAKEEHEREEKARLERLEKARQSRSDEAPQEGSGVTEGAEAIESANQSAGDDASGAKASKASKARKAS